MGVDDDEGDFFLDEFFDDDADRVRLAGAGLREDARVLLDERVGVEDDGEVGALEEPEEEAFVRARREAQDLLEDVSGGAADLRSGLERRSGKLKEAAFVALADDADAA